MGLRGPYGAVFSGVEWSVEGTMTRACEAGLSVWEVWCDVHEPEDLARLEEELRVRPDLAARNVEVSREP